MKPPPPSPDDRPATTLVILRDGTIHAHQLTPALAEALADLNPADETMARRAGHPTHRAIPPTTDPMPHELRD